jgi:hypothetical protein
MIAADSMLPSFALSTPASSQTTGTIFQDHRKHRCQRLYYEIAASDHHATLRKTILARDSSPQCSGVFDDFVWVGRGKFQISLFIRNSVLWAGERHAVVRILERGLEACKLGFVCVSRNIESFGCGSFSGSDIHFIAFESNPRIRLLGWDCFTFVSCLPGFSIPTIENSGDVGGWSREQDLMSESLSGPSGELEGDWDDGETIRRSGDVGVGEKLQERTVGLGNVVEDDREEPNGGRFCDDFVIFSRLSFSNCVSLFWVCIPNCVEVLWPNCFCDCHSLQAVVFERESKVCRIDSEVFAECS